MTTKSKINDVLSKACKSLSAKMNSYHYKDYILSMLFVKYLSDIFKEKNEKFMMQYDGDEQRVARALRRERFVMDKDSTFDFLYENRNDPELGQKINVTLSHIEENNSATLRNVFSSIDFNSQENFGNIKEKNEILRNLLENFNSIDLRPGQLGSDNIISDVFERMIEHFAVNSGEFAKDFFTPPQVSELLVALVQPTENDRIYDPTCGVGGLLLKSYTKIPSGKAEIYGQESNAQTWSLCKLNMLIHGLDDACIWNGDTLTNPQNIAENKLMKFQCVVANPTYGINKWNTGFISNAAVNDEGINQETKILSYDPWKRFDVSAYSTIKSDYAFVLHMLSSLDDDVGRMAIVLPNGALFRGLGDGKIRRKIIESNLLDAVIGLPEKLFYGTPIPTCILVFKKNRTNRDVLFIDASTEGNYKKGMIQNTLREEDIKRIVTTYEARKNVDKYAYVASYDEIKEKDFNLTVLRYVDTLEGEEVMDINEVMKNIENIEEKLSMTQEKMKKYLEELGYKI